MLSLLQPAECFYSHDGNNIARSTLPHTHIYDTKIERMHMNVLVVVANKTVSEATLHPAAIYAFVYSILLVFILFIYLWMDSFFSLLSCLLHFLFCFHRSARSLDTQIGTHSQRNIDWMNMMKSNLHLFVTLHGMKPTMPQTELRVCHESLFFHLFVAV